MIGVPVSSAERASRAASRLAFIALLPRASFSRRGIAFSTVWRSARISSVWMVEMSLAGLTSPSTWVTSSSRKTRVTWQIAADSRMWERNLLPRPSPCDAPATMPAMSTNSTVAGSTLALAEHLRELRQPVVRDPDHADVGLDRRERVVRREDVVLGQSVEEGRLARVGESDDADGECHGPGVYGACDRPTNPSGDGSRDEPRPGPRRDRSCHSVAGGVWLERRRAASAVVKRSRRHRLEPRTLWTRGFGPVSLSVVPG